MKNLIAITSMLVLLITACPPSNPATFNDSSVIEMQKTACFGTCPVYTIHIEGNGNAKLEGEMHFDKIGSYKKQLTKEETADLFNAFAASDFWSFQDEYTGNVTDLPTTYLTFENLGQSKKVEDYYGAPQKLKDLEALVEAIANSTGWEQIN